MSTVSAPDDALLSLQVQRQWARAVDGQRQRVIFGAIMLQLRARFTVSARGPSGRFGEKGQGLKGWLEKHAPEVTRSVAYRLMTVASGLRKTAQLDQTADLVNLLATSPADLSPELREKRAAIDRLIAGKSQRQLLRGVSDDGSTKAPKLSPEEEEQQLLEVLRIDCTHAARTIEALGPKYRILDDASAESLASLLETKAREIRAWLRTPPNQRLPLDPAAALLGEAGPFHQLERFQ